MDAPPPEAIDELVLEFPDEAILEAPVDRYSRVSMSFLVRHNLVQPEERPPKPSLDAYDDSPLSRFDDDEEMQEQMRLKKKVKKSKSSGLKISMPKILKSWNPVGMVSSVGSTVTKTWKGMDSIDTTRASVKEKVRAKVRKSKSSKAAGVRKSKKSKEVRKRYIFIFFEAHRG